MNAERITELFPALEQIRDEELRSLSVKAMAEAMERGGWTEENLQLAPVSIKVEGCRCNLIGHINLVAELCLAALEKVSGYYAANGFPLDRDTVLCGALLHDIALIEKVGDRKDHHLNERLLSDRILHGFSCPENIFPTKSLSSLNMNMASKSISRPLIPMNRCIPSFLAARSMTSSFPAII